MFTFPHSSNWARDKGKVDTYMVQCCPNLAKIAEAKQDCGLLRRLLEGGNVNIGASPIINAHSGSIVCLTIASSQLLQIQSSFT